MKKILLSLVLLFFPLFISSCVKDVSNENNCESKCESVGKICSEVITFEECNQGCNSCGIGILDKIEDRNDCSKLKDIFSKCNLPTEDLNNCEAACNNYNSQCLSLVPNANQKLFDEGFESCMNECNDWDEEKIECMEVAQDCPSMTDICGL